MKSTKKKNVLTFHQAHVNKHVREWGGEGYLQKTKALQHSCEQSSVILKLLR